MRSSCSRTLGAQTLQSRWLGSQVVSPTIRRTKLPQMWLAELMMLGAPVGETATRTP